jgi:hypothetical protein
MERKYTESNDDLDQFLRVQELLSGVSLFPYLIVTLKDGSLVSGRHISNVTGCNRKIPGSSYYGSLIVQTEHGEVNIDYLDVQDLYEQSSN